MHRDERTVNCPIKCEWRVEYQIGSHSTVGGLKFQSFSRPASRQSSSFQLSTRHVDRATATYFFWFGLFGPKVHLGVFAMNALTDRPQNSTASTTSRPRTLLSSRTAGACCAKPTRSLIRLCTRLCHLPVNGRVEAVRRTSAESRIRSSTRAPPPTRSTAARWRRRQHRRRPPAAWTR
jgi:hypothetical protein